MRIAVADPNKQFNATLSPELKKRLQELADQYGRETGLDKGTKVGARIIETYVEVWAQSQERIREGKRQIEQAEQEALAKLGRPPLVKGETTKTNPTARRKKKP